MKKIVIIWAALAVLAACRGGYRGKDPDYQYRLDHYYQSAADYIDGFMPMNELAEYVVYGTAVNDNTEYDAELVLVNGNMYLYIAGDPRPVAYAPVRRRSFDLKSDILDTDDRDKAYVIENVLYLNHNDHREGTLSNCLIGPYEFFEYRTWYDKPIYTYELY